MGWEKVTLANRSEVELYKQEKEQECGPSCVATVARLFNRPNIDIIQARRAVGDLDHNKPLGYKYGHDWERDWSYITSLTQILSEWGVRMAHTKRKVTDHKQFCADRSTTSPAILRIEWSDGSGHFVVALGRNGSSGQDFIEILDPFHGYQQVLLSDYPNYLTGKIDPFWSIETT